MFTLHSRGTAALVIILTLLADQWTKAWARASLMHAGRRSYFGDFFRFDYAENRGAFLSLGASMNNHLRALLFTGLVTVGVASLLYVTFRNRKTRRLLPFALISAGGIGNLIDRYVFDGAVTDFMNIGIGGLRTGIFNIADMVIMVGIVWLLIADRGDGKVAEPTVEAQ
jgi:signal peptidase II